MMDEPAGKILSDIDLAAFGGGGSVAGRAWGLLRQQMNAWPLLRAGMEGLGSVRVRVFNFDGFTVRVQFNPGRIASTAAPVDPESVKKRECFLCSRNLPAGQKGIAFQEGYLILCNPYPIFPEHFTVVHREHVPQRIEGNFWALLRLSAELSASFTVLYNGPRSGASAPDHMHFQMGTRSVLPLEKEYEEMVRSRGVTLLEERKLRAWALAADFRRFILLRSPDAAALDGAFTLFSQVFRNLAHSDDEPMINILAWQEGGEWILVLFPREKHRPASFYEEGEKKILLSPGAVDLGGMCIVPREEDFKKLSRETVRAALGEVALQPEAFGRLVEEFGGALRRDRHQYR